MNEGRANPARTRQVDVIVLGGGPAGSAVALALIRAGCSVTVLERSRFEDFRVGETLPPEVRPLLIELGVWDRFLSDGHFESPGIAVSWGGSELYGNDHILNPYGPGWHVDRRCFDSMLARCAAASGVEVMTGVRPITSVHFDSDGHHVEVPTHGGRMVRRSSFLVDATGRASSFARRYGGRRIVLDPLVGLVGLFGIAAGETDQEGRLLVEAVESGWWYELPVPRDRLIATFLTDADMIPRRRAERVHFWRHELGRTQHACVRLGGASKLLGFKVVSACSSWLDEAAGRGWLAVGDAAAAFDPLSSRGIMWALESGLAGARAVSAHLRGDSRALVEYANWVAAECGDYLRIRGEYYGRERRWPNSSFWRRRHTPFFSLVR